MARFFIWRLTAEWITKAAADFAIVERESRALSYLSDYAVNFRYPGESADRHTGLQARSFCRGFRKAARTALRVE